MIWAVTLLLAMAVAAALVVVRRRYLVVTVEGHSMQPTYVAGDRLLVRRTHAGHLRPGMAVVFHSPAGVPDRSALDGVLASGEQGRVRRMLADDRLLVKRVAAVAGDPVPADRVPGLAGDAVPPGKLVVLGDNPAVSYDSREHGYLDGALVVGIAVRPLTTVGSQRAEAKVSIID